MAQAGEFGFVLVSFTVANAVVPAPVADLLLLVVALSMLLTPVLFIRYDKIIAPRYSRQQVQDADEITLTPRSLLRGMVVLAASSALLFRPPTTKRR